MCVSLPQTPDKASVHCLTESFVTKLQVDFPSTVSTIYRSVGTHVCTHTVCTLVFEDKTKSKFSLRSFKPACVLCRTSEKLQTAGRSSISTNLYDRCLFCMCTMDTAVGKCYLYRCWQEGMSSKYHIIR